MEDLTPVLTAVSSETLNGVSTKKYSYDVFGSPMTLTEESSRYSYLFNPHGSIALVIDQTNNVKQSYAYTAYGSTHAGLTRSAQGFGAKTNLYRYTGKRLDVTSQTYDMGARRFMLLAGRFLQRDTTYSTRDIGFSFDPISANRYALAAGNPINYIEVDGHYAAYVDEWGQTARSWAERVIQPTEPATGEAPPSSEPTGNRIDSMATELPLGTLWARPSDDWYKDGAYLHGWISQNNRSAINYTVSARAPLAKTLSVEWDVRLNGQEMDRGQFTATDYGRAKGGTRPCWEGEWVLYAEAQLGARYFGPPIRESLIPECDDYEPAPGDNPVPFPVILPFPSPGSSGAPAPKPSLPPFWTGGGGRRLAL